MAMGVWEHERNWAICNLIFNLLLQYQNEVMSLKVTLGLICFPDDTNPHILEIWEEMKACYEYHEKII